MFKDVSTAEPPCRSVKHFPTRPSAGWVAFDVAFGIVLPLVCLYFDPFVFRHPFGEPLLGAHLVVAAVAIGLGLLSLSTWLLIRWPPAFMAGLLAGGAIFASLLGVVLLPFSLLGLVVFIGILGFSPFVTAFVFWRNALHAYRQACEARTTAGMMIPVALGLAVSCAGPWAAQGYVTCETSRALEMVLSEDPAEAAQGLSVFRRFHLFAVADRLVLAYAAENDPGRRKKWAEIYRELTGASIEHRLARLRD
jgi:hypothetical protein